MKPIQFFIALMLFLFGLTASAQCPKVTNLKVSANFTGSLGSVILTEKILPMTWSVLVSTAVVSTVAPTCTIEVQTGVILPVSPTVYTVPSSNGNLVSSIININSVSYRQYNYVYTLPTDIMRNNTSQQRIEVKCTMSGCLSSSYTNINIPNGGIATVIISGKRIAFSASTPCDPTALTISNISNAVTYIDDAVAGMRQASPSAHPILLQFLDNDNSTNGQSFSFTNWSAYDDAKNSLNSPLRLYLKTWKLLPYTLTNHSFITY